MGISGTAATSRVAAGAASFIYEFRYVNQLKLLEFRLEGALLFDIPLTCVL